MKDAGVERSVADLDLHGEPHHADRSVEQVTARAAAAHFTLRILLPISLSLSLGSLCAEESIVLFFFFVFWVCLSKKKGIGHAQKEGRGAAHGEFPK